MYNYYEEEYEPTEEEMEEMDGMENTKVNQINENIKIEFDTVNFTKGIVSAVVSQLKEQLYKEIVKEIKKECLEDVKEKILLQTHEIIRETIDEFMENDKVTIGGNGIWDDEPKEELTLKQYSKRCIKKVIEEQKFTVITGIEKNRYNNQYTVKKEDWTFDSYLQSKLGIGNDVKAYLDTEVDKVRKQINNEVKEIFDESTKSMLSQSVLNILMANDTYGKIEKNIASIADRKD